MPPALPWAEDAASLAAEAALLTLSPAEELTLVKPSDAFDVTCDTVSLALEAAEEAAEETALVASEVVEALRTATRWKKRRVGRSAVRATEADIVLNVVSRCGWGAVVNNRISEEELRFELRAR